jgi:hypothetical protein
MGRTRRAVYVSVVRNEFLWKQMAQNFMLCVERGQWLWRAETVRAGHDDAVH